MAEPAFVTQGQADANEGQTEKELEVKVEKTEVCAAEDATDATRDAEATERDVTGNGVQREEADAGNEAKSERDESSGNTEPQAGE